MKKIILTSTILLSLLSCKKDIEKREESNEDTTVFSDPFKYETPPCTPDTNSTYFGGFKMDYTNPSAHNNPYYLSSGWEISGGSSFSTLSFEFRAKPKQQKYVTKYYGDINSDNQVYVSGVFGLGLAQFYSVGSGDTVYVKVIDEANNIYSVSFCDLEFDSGSASPFRTDGNLTTN